ncbi:hypothetical protein NHE_0315 [Neorickettsia helminthoeca str. Oregon]|uniref:Uncharacterized protein n=1 Tax=Neorickettsia helminthoeca str. Oregon TaxID=1286528 RepID=X5H3J8_9RICK|nr:hypothetical protein [Neorickettsia helminthoeca]AHX11273.1 hypothetical protein NHE_0315 [Neorickettsia helminthoeca str. Oregon]
MSADSKESFLDRLKKRKPSGEGGDSGGGGFASRFSKSTPVTSGRFSEKFATSKASGDFASQRSVQKSRKDAAGFAEGVRKKRSDCVYLVRGKDRDRAAWHYVLVDKVKKEMFLAAAKSGSLDVKDYGEVLYSGWGEDPPEHIKKKIDEEYN